MRQNDKLEGTELREEKGTGIGPEAEWIIPVQGGNQRERQDRQLGGEGDRQGAAGWAGGGCIAYHHLLFS